MSSVTSHHVSTDSLYGVKTFFLVSACSDKAEMTFPRVSRDLLILAPSYQKKEKHTHMEKLKKQKKPTTLAQREVL